MEKSITVPYPRWYEWPLIYVMRAFYWLVNLFKRTFIKLDLEKDVYPKLRKDLGNLKNSDVVLLYHYGKLVKLDAKQLKKK